MTKIKKRCSASTSQKGSWSMRVMLSSYRGLHAKYASALALMHRGLDDDGKELALDILGVEGKWASRGWRALVLTTTRPLAPRATGRTTWAMTRTRLAALPPPRICLRMPTGARLRTPDPRDEFWDAKVVKVMQRCPLT